MDRPCCYPSDGDPVERLLVLNDDRESHYRQLATYEVDVSGPLETSVDELLRIVSELPS